MWIIFTSSIFKIITCIVVGICFTSCHVIEGFFSSAGILLPFGYGQGTGQALNYGTIYETEYGFTGGKTFGLTIAALGFISASVGGVIHLNILRKKNKITVSDKDEGTMFLQEIQPANEIPMQDSMDKMTIQVAFVIAAYFVAYLLMVLLGLVLPGMKSVIFGFNFILGVLSATLFKTVINLMRKKKIINHGYVNDFLMTRISNFFFDIMVVAGVAAIRLGVLEKYWGIMLILGVVGLVSTYIYNLVVAKTLFKDYPQEQFLMMYGMLTGTASTGTILLREIDGEFKTPASDNMVYQNFPAIVFGFPMMLLANLAPENPPLTMALLIPFFIIMNIILFRSKIFKKRK